MRAASAPCGSRRSTQARISSCSAGGLGAAVDPQRAVDVIFPQPAQHGLADRLEDGVSTVSPADSVETFCDRFRASTPRKRAPPSIVPPSWTDDLRARPLR